MPLVLFPRLGNAGAVDFQGAGGGACHHENPTGYFFALRGYRFLLPFHVVLIGRYLSLPEQGADRAALGRCLLFSQGPEALPILVRYPQLETSAALCEHDTPLWRFKQRIPVRRAAPSGATRLTGRYAIRRGSCVIVPACPERS